MGPISKPSSFFFFFFITSLLLFPLLIKSDDFEALSTLKSSIDPSNSLHWTTTTEVCNWEGIKQCINGRVTKLVLEHFNLTGQLNETSLNQLDQLRVLSLKSNSLSGQIPSLSGLKNLKSLFLNQNNFSGDFPVSLSLLHRLKTIVLSDNQISGQIPPSLLNLPRLYQLYLQNNRIKGEIPPFNQTSLRFFNVSNNQLSGEIPLTPALVRFNSSSFDSNIALCGVQINIPCNVTNGSPPSESPMASPPVKKHKRRWKIVAIIAGTVGGFVFILLFLLVLCLVCRKILVNKSKTSREERGKSRAAVGGGEEEASGGGGNDKKGGFSTWEGEGLGSLVFCGPGEEQMSYSLEDLLKASAETLGRGTVGSTYKAVMESGFIVTVKRLKDSRYPLRVEEFRRHMEVLGRLSHPNLVRIRAYFQAKEERLLVYDYFPNGSLFSLIHGTRASGGGKPLHWTSCLKIAEDLATGLVYIHQNPGLTHGNIKSSNVLLGSDFESCLTDYGLNPFKNPDTHEESSASSLFYRAPECRDIRKPPTQQSDVYSFGVLLLELLTGKTPFQDLVLEHGSDIPMWVRSVREEETESGDSNDASEEKLGALLNIAMSCVSIGPEDRPVMREVLRMIREMRAEAQASSNSSDHSPGRWSDTVQSLPREEHLSI
ncbi:hypothetical protein Vadar_015628 [Vaccinium darrowii]|uniref:Uncharacterized protein n=1 Tax=Vaccinium darrowii TaxID=229202 RepID=A0ACB7XHP2_9ERIC|nr:hypothetical protein Vadar_015628 [Vaccinium darrowii]